ncbi:MAG: hypothetical protein AB7Q42_16190 [Acidimicrobiia bacterium]
MPRRNRVDPWGDLHAVSGRGLFTGNRGCLVDAAGDVVRHHRSSLWIVCMTEFREWRFPLADPNRWTPIFFLDDAVALAAGHRPCATCRRDAYRSYRDAVTRAVGSGMSLLATDLDRRLVAERLDRGRGLARSPDRRLWETDIAELPDGAVIVDEQGAARLVLDDRLLAFDFDGWSSPVDRSPNGRVTVLTPPTSVAALAHGYSPVLHGSAVGSPR